MIVSADERELLLAHLLNVDLAHLLANSPKLTLLQRWQYSRLLAKRARGWPIAYLVGEKWFYGRPFYVNRSVLIPRPETEALVDHVLQIFRSSDIRTIVDVGTGSGCIAVTLAAELGVQVIATDVSRRALAVARRNAQRHRMEKLITFRHTNLLDGICTGVAPQRPHGNNIIIANLPYLPADHGAEQTPYEPTGALYGGGQDGLGLIRALVDQCRGVKFCPPTAIILEIDPRQANAVNDLLAQEMPNGETKIYPDLSGQMRVVVWKIT
jgi:release factor glutamine methyltransferase